MVKLLIERIKCMGKIPLCNGRADRAFHIGSFCFPLCWRCTSLIFTIIFCMVFSFILLGDKYCDTNFKLLILGSILIIPTGIDGIVQYRFGIESNNRRRIILGIISGIGLWIWCSFISKTLGIW